MSAEIWVAIVSTVGLIVVAFITNRTRQHAKASRVQLENEHRNEDGSVINMREEADDRHAEYMQAFQAIFTMVQGTKSDVRGLRRDIGRLADADRDAAERIRDLEKTQPRERKAND